MQFSQDEDHFHLNGHDNQQNMCVWAKENNMK
jgi:hypothetical protein